MSIENIKNALPEYAKDLKLNLSNLIMDETLNAQQKAGCFLACAMASRNKILVKNIMEEVENHLDESALNGAKAAAAMMGMNNIYYRFVHLASNKEYQSMQAKLRMNIIANPGVDRADFELWCLAVSAINGCGACIDSHEAILIKHGFSKEQVQTSIRIASVLHAIACVFDAEEAFK